MKLFLITCPEGQYRGKKTTGLRMEPCGISQEEKKILSRECSISALEQEPVFFFTLSVYLYAQL